MNPTHSKKNIVFDMDIPVEVAAEMEKSSKSILTSGQEGGFRATVQRSIGFLDAEDREEEMEPEFPAVQGTDASIKHRMKSSDSFHSNGSTGESRGRPLLESFPSKLWFMRTGILAIVLNLLLLVFGIILVSEEGFVIHFHEMEFPMEQIAPVLLVTLMLVIHTMTYRGFTDSLAVYFGIRLSQPTGFTLAVVGMVQSPFWVKLTLAHRIKGTQGAKGILARISLAYLLHSCLLMIPVFSVLEMYSRTREVDQGTLACVVYHQNGKQMDRGWPTSQIAMGTGEYLFGKSVGRLRSQEAVQNTLFLSPPQLIDVCEDGTTIMGAGFTAQIDTECMCAGSPTPVVLEAHGIPSRDASHFSAAHASLDLNVGMVNGIYWVNKTIEIYTLLTSTNLCGGYPGNLHVPVCTTKIHQLKHAQVQIRYMTDGSSASMAPNHAQVLETQGPADIEWLYNGFVWLHGGIVSTTLLPSLVPNSVNPLLWWTTPNTMVVSPSLVEAGIETTFAILSKAAIQRSFLTQGKLCHQSILLLDELVAFLTPLGFRITMTFFIGQCIMHLVSLGFFSLWFFQKEPVLPGIHCCHLPSHLFSFLQSPLLLARVNELSATMEDAYFWPRFDLTIRVGESISTLEDPEFGQIVADKPKMVGSLSPTKLYQ
jgi:hypothetical protein